MKSPHGFAWFPLLAAIAIVFGISGGTYWYVHQKAAPQSQDTKIDCAAMHLPPDCNLGAKEIPRQTSPRAALSASPSSGPAPLTVNFSGYAPLFGDSYLDLAYGDGEDNLEAVNVSACIDSGDTDNCHVAASHTYKNPGTYIAKIYEAKGHSVEATVTIIVTRANSQ